MHETIGNRVRKARRARGLSQEEVAQKGGPARTTLSRLERGADQEPERYTIESLVDALGVRPEWLLFGAGPMFSDGVAEKPTPYQEDPPLSPAKRIILRAVEADLANMTDEQAERWFIQYQKEKATIR